MYSVVLATMLTAGGTTPDWGLLRCLFGHSRGNAGVACAPAVTTWSPYVDGAAIVNGGAVATGYTNGYYNGYGYNGYGYNYDGYAYGSQAYPYNPYSGYSNWNYVNGSWQYPYSNTSWNWTNPNYYGYAGTYPYSQGYYPYATGAYPYSQGYYPYATGSYPYSGSYYPYSNAYAGYYPYANTYGRYSPYYLRNEGGAQVQATPPAVHLQANPNPAPLSVAEVDALRHMLHRGSQAQAQPQFAPPAPQRSHAASQPNPGLAPAELDALRALLHQGRPPVPQNPHAAPTLPGQHLTPFEMESMRNRFGAPAQLQSLPGQSSNAQTIPGKVTVSLPADARLWVDAMEAPRGQSLRTIATPPLQVGTQYFYDLTVEHVQNGEVVRDTQRVGVRAGAETRVDFTGSRLVAR